jgi:PAS domain S-box-containing protein
VSLFTSIRNFFGEPEPIVVSAPKTATVLSFDIVSYALSLASRPESLSAQRARLGAIIKAGEDDEALAKLYIEIESYLINDEPARNFRQDELRQRIWERYAQVQTIGGLLLMFAPPAIQEVKLAEEVLTGVLQKIGRLLGQRQLDIIAQEATTGGRLAGVKISPTGVSFDKVEGQIEAPNAEEMREIHTEIANLFTILFVRLRTIEGMHVASVFEEAYLDVKNRYQSFVSDISKIATLLPEGVAEEEKLRYLSHENLENIVREKTKQLESEKATVELKVKERTRELVETQAKLSSSIESLAQGLLMVGNEGQIILKNPATAKILGYDDREWDLDDVAKDMTESVNLLEAIATVRKTGTPLVVKEVKSGNRILRLSLTPVLSSQHVISVVILIEDITEAKVLERSREEFFSIASHELRTPLTAIRGNTSLIQQYYPKVLEDPDLRGMVSDIHESSIRLIEIVNDFLDASRLEQGRMKFTMADFNVSDVIEKVTYELGGVSKEKKIYLHLDHDIKAKTIPLVYADVDRVKQVLYNLIGNAMKFVETGGVTISTQTDGDHLKISVSDTGPGIGEEGQRLLFHKFQQAGKSIVTRDTTRGTGLGLYISKLLLEHMDGDITLDESIEGKGSIFSFTLPLAKNATHAPAPEPAATPAPEPAPTTPK